MKVVVAVDSFKGSMTSMEAGMAVKEGILAAKKDAEVIVKPLADKFVFSCCLYSGASNAVVTFFSVKEG